MSRTLAVVFLLCVNLASAASPKRGVCAKDLSAKDFEALKPGVSWWYNWYFKPDGAGDKSPFEFRPMMWGDSPDLWSGLEKYLEGGAKPKMLLGLNEPNLKSQCGLAPEATAKAYLRLKKIADRYGIPLVGPHMAIGSPAEDSVKAWDPVEKKEILYTYMVPFLNAFKHYLGSEPMPALGIHSYGNTGELKWVVGELRKLYGVKVWVTEFNEWKAPSAEAQKTYLLEAVDFLEKSPDVEGYAWFMARMDNPNQSLFEKEPGRLSPLGLAYVNAPVPAKP